MSIGTPVKGFLVNGAELPVECDFCRVMDEQAGRATNFGTGELVAAVRRAAEAVAEKYPGSVLPVGNLARGGGGRLKWSISHRSGRDADLGFYLIDDNNEQIFQNGMTKVERDGTMVLDDETTASFDVARNWWLVRSILSDRTVSVQWIFMADHLKDRMMDYARSCETSRRLLERADEVVAQPRGPIHDDHFHVRIYCSRDDLLEGCVDIGTNRSWYTKPSWKVSARFRELKKLSRSRDPKVRRDAVTVLGHFGNRAGRQVIAERLSDSDPQVRRAAVEALDWIGCRGVEKSVARAVNDPEMDDALAYRLLNRLLVEFSSNWHPKSLDRVLESLAVCNRKLSIDNGVFNIELMVSEQVAEAGFVQDGDAA